MVLNIVFSPFGDNILESKTKQVDDVKLYYFTISINGLFEHSDVNIRINVFDIGWILYLLYGNFVANSDTCCTIGG
jgi:hypothetical protein